MHACDGAGACTPGESIDCDPYACGDGQCEVRCETDSDCITGLVCDSTGTCAVPSSTDAGCLDVVTSIDEDGNVQSCAPFRCLDGTCKTTCEADTDCAGSRRCEAGECVIDTYDGELAEPPPTLSLDVGSCGCRTSGAPPRGTPVATALVALALGLRRRQRQPCRTSNWK